MAILLYTECLKFTQKILFLALLPGKTLQKVPIGSLAQRLGSLCNLTVKKLGGVKWSSVQVILQKGCMVNNAPSTLKHSAEQLPFNL